MPPPPLACFDTFFSPTFSNFFVVSFLFPFFLSLFFLAPRVDDSVGGCEVGRSLRQWQKGVVVIAVVARTLPT